MMNVSFAKIGLAVGAVLLMVGCASSFGSCAPKGAEAKKALIRRDVVNPPNYFADNQYPTSIDLVDNYTTITGWVRKDEILVERAHSFQFEFGSTSVGRTYIATRATCSWSSAGFQLESVSFAEYRLPTYYTALNVDYPYVFSAFNPSNDYYYVYENADTFDSLAKFTISKSAIFYGTQSSIQTRVVVQKTLTAGTSGPYYVENSDSTSWFLRLEHIFAPYFMIDAPDYNNGYQKGYYDGYNDVNQQKYDEGYQAGLADGSSSASAPVTGLFGAVVGVPISILNGLAPFVIWDIPIISILATFLFFGTALWILRKMLAK